MAGTEAAITKGEGVNMSEMQKRIIETLKRLPIHDNVNPGGELDELRLREAARQILGALRDPTSEMLYFGVGNKDALQTWNLMINAALK